MYDWLNQWKWHAVESRGKFYAARRRPDVYMHRLIMGAGPGVEIDHEDLDGLNNCLSNLRWATRADNQRNKGIVRHNTSGYKGVSWNKRLGKWEAYIMIENRKVHLSYSDDPGTAAKDYDRSALEHFGEFARTNASLRGTSG